MDPDDGSRRQALIRDRLGGPEYRKLFLAARRRFEEAWPDPVRSFTMADVDVHERKAVSELLGWKMIPTGQLKIRVEDLDRALRTSDLGVGVLDVVVGLGGPIAPRRPARAAAMEARTQFWRRAAQHPAVLARPDLGRWLDDLRQRGLLSRLAREGDDQEQLLELALEVVSRLPASRKLLSVLAAEVAADAHALDPGQPLSAIALRAVVRLAGWPELPTSAAERRRLWAEVGVLCDPLSTDVLVLGLRPRGGLLARHLRELADEGEPRRVTLRELSTNPLEIDAGTRVFICENPGIVNAAADQLGPRCPPLVCLEGVRSTAALELLTAFRKAGALLCFHADFDWGGVRIGNAMFALGATPWRFGASNYRGAFSLTFDAADLKGDLVAASWDADLAPAMNEVRRVIFEEQVLSELIADLRGASSESA